MDYREAVTLALKNNQDGVAFLYQQTYESKLKLALQYMKNEADAEDVLQEAYLRAFTHLDKLDNPEHFSAWLGKIVQRTALNQLRKKSPALFSEMVSDEDSDEYDPEDDRGTFQPEWNVTTEETVAITHQLINSLTDEQRVCIVLYHLQDQPIRVIATQLGCSENTVKSRLKYGRDNIRKKGEQLKKQGVQLYVFAPIPMLLYFMEQDFAIRKESGAFTAGQQAVYSEVQQGLYEVTTAGQSAGSAGSAASKAAGKGMLAGSSTSKIIAVIVAASLGIGGGNIAYVGAQNRATQATVEESSTEVTDREDVDHASESITSSVESTVETESVAELTFEEQMEELYLPTKITSVREYEGFSGEVVLDLQYDFNGKVIYFSETGDLYGGEAGIYLNQIVRGLQSPDNYLGTSTLLQNEIAVTGTIFDYSDDPISFLSAQSSWIQEGVIRSIDEYYSFDVNENGVVSSINMYDEFMIDQYQYDEAGRLTVIDSGNDGYTESERAEFSYNNENELVGGNYSSIMANGSIEDIRYEDGAITSLRQVSNDSSVGNGSVTCEYDSFGRISIIRREGYTTSGNTYTKERSYRYNTQGYLSEYTVSSNEDGRNSVVTEYYEYAKKKSLSDDLEQMAIAYTGALREYARNGIEVHGYSIYDMDNNGVKELLCIAGNTQAEMMMHVYSYNANGLLDCGEVGAGHLFRFMKADSGVGVEIGSIHSGTSWSNIITLVNGQLQIGEGYSKTLEEEERIDPDGTAYVDRMIRLEQDESLIRSLL